MSSTPITFKTNKPIKKTVDTIYTAILEHRARFTADLEKHCAEMGDEFVDPFNRFVNIEDHERMMIPTKGDKFIPYYDFVKNTYEGRGNAKVLVSSKADSGFKTKMIKTGKEVQSVFTFYLSNYISEVLHCLEHAGDVTAKDLRAYSADLDYSVAPFILSVIDTGAVMFADEVLTTELKKQCEEAGLKISDTGLMFATGVWWKFLDVLALTCANIIWETKTIAFVKIINTAIAALNSTGLLNNGHSLMLKKFVAEQNVKVAKKPAAKGGKGTGKGKGKGRGKGKKEAEEVDEAEAEEDADADADADEADEEDADADEE